MIGHIHVVPRGETWGVVREGDDGEITSYLSHDDALKVGQEIAQEEHTELVLHEHARWSLPETAGDWWRG